MHCQLFPDFLPLGKCFCHCRVSAKEPLCTTCHGIYLCCKGFWGITCCKGFWGITICNCNSLLFVCNTYSGRHIWSHIDPPVCPSPHLIFSCGCPSQGKFRKSHTDWFPVRTHGKLPRNPSLKSSLLTSGKDLARVVKALAVIGWATLMSGKGKREVDVERVSFDLSGSVRLESKGREWQCRVRSLKVALKIVQLFFLETSWRVIKTLHFLSLFGH